MKLYHWAAIIAGGALITASAAAVVASQKTAEPNDVRLAALKNNQSNPPIVRESQLRQQPPAAAPEAAAPQRTETIRYDSWVVICQESLDGKTKMGCRAGLRVLGADRSQVLLNWQIGLNGERHFVTAFNVPTGLAIKKGNAVVGGGLNIQKGVEVKFGNGQPRRINYSSCNPRRCFAEALIDDAFVKDALANNKATVTVYAENGEAIPLEISVSGIDKAISATRK